MDQNHLHSSLGTSVFFTLQVRTGAVVTVWCPSRGRALQKNPGGTGLQNAWKSTRLIPGFAPPAAVFRASAASMRFCRASWPIHSFRPLISSGRASACLCSADISSRRLCQKFACFLLAKGGIQWASSRMSNRPRPRIRRVLFTPSEANLKKGLFRHA